MKTANAAASGFSVEKERLSLFYDAMKKVIYDDEKQGGIGTLGEKNLHAVLKLFFEPDKSFHELKAGRFCADIARDGHIIEIQTRSFDRLRKKIPYYLDEGYVVTVVYPVAAVKWICWIDAEKGEITDKRKSPRKGSVYDIVPELYKIKSILKSSDLEFDILLLEVQDYRNLDGYGNDRKKRSTRYERIPLSLLGEVCTGASDNFSALVPDGLPDVFTSRDFADAAGIARSAASLTLSILTEVSAVERVGKEKNSYIYRVRK